MIEVYFTFGSDPKFPYDREQYVKIIGKDVKDCTATFRKHFPQPDKKDKTLNCADYYSGKTWEDTKHNFEGRLPAKTLVSDTLFGTRKEGFDNIWIYVPDKNTLVFIQEGSGDNLDREDTEEGFVDYIDYTSYYVDFLTGGILDDDGGMEMYKQMVHDHYGCLTDAVPDILGALYGNPLMDVVILEKRRIL